jgi:hypothetical protein
MASLSYGRVVDEMAGTYSEGVAFVGESLEAVDTEVRQWLMRVMPMGSCTLSIRAIATMDGTQSRIDLFYRQQQRAEDRIEPTGVLHTEARRL